jgi:hypothetical protein
MHPSPAEGAKGKAKCKPRREMMQIYTLSLLECICVRGPGEQDCRSDRRGSGGGGGKRSRSDGILAR